MADTVCCIIFPCCAWKLPLGSLSIRHSDAEYSNRSSTATSNSAENDHLIQGYNNCRLSVAYSIYGHQLKHPPKHPQS
jgi:hypothetical protein